MPEITVPATTHFTLELLADGVYAAIATEAGAAYSNAGIVDLGDQTLIFDTFDLPQAAAELRDAAERLTGRPAAYVVNSHFHGDHWSGNQIFPGVPILATATTRRGILAQFGELRALVHDPTPLHDVLRQYRARLETEADEARRALLLRAIRRVNSSLEALPGLDPRPPTVTFERSLVLHGAHRRAELRSAGRAHTASDAYLLLPAERVAFIGDLGFFDCQPFMASSEPPAWGRRLQHLEQLPYDTFVPGHGPVGTCADLARQRRFLAALEAGVAAVVAAGGTVDEALQSAFPEEFRAWAATIARTEANVRFLYRRLSSAA